MGERMRHECAALLPAPLPLPVPIGRSKQPPLLSLALSYKKSGTEHEE